MNGRVCEKLTSNTPTAAKVVVNVHDDWADNKAGNVACSVEETEAPAGREIEVLLPAVERLEAANQGPVI